MVNLAQLLCDTGRALDSFRRVEYNVAETAQKIYATGELERFLGDRLFEGK